VKPGALVAHHDHQLADSRLFDRTTGHYTCELMILLQTKAMIICCGQNTTWWPKAILFVVVKGHKIGTPTDQ